MTDFYDTPDNAVFLCHDLLMTEQQLSAGVVPAWTLGDRMRKALDHANVAVADMADYLDVTPATISRWVNDRSPVRRSTLLLWAMRTGVSQEWLETGSYAIRDSNPEPAALRHPRSHLRLLSLEPGGGVLTPPCTPTLQPALRIVA